MREREKVCCIVRRNRAKQKRDTEQKSRAKTETFSVVNIVYVVGYMLT